MTPLHKLAAWNKCELIERLLAHRDIVDCKAALSATSASGDTPLHYAAETHAERSFIALVTAIEHDQRPTLLQTTLNKANKSVVDVLQETFSIEEREKLLSDLQSKGVDCDDLKF
jgi:ankyrin repeat protein